MTRLTKLAIIPVAALSLAACSGMELDRARGVQPQGTDFAVNLYQGYLGLSEAEFAEADYADSDAFARRAIAAGTGQPPLPEALDGRELPADMVGDLAEARTRLFAALAGNARLKAPEQAAVAQAMFDCWMQEQEENFQPDDIAACRDRYLAAIKDVELAMTPKPTAKAEPKPRAKMAAKPRPMVQLVPANRVFFVYFDFDSADLSDAARTVIGDTAEAARAVGAGAKLMVSGHTDRAGSSAYNQRLSNARAGAVVKALVADGVAAGSIDQQALGESQPVFKTDDGVREAGNRRVQIDVTR